MRKITLWGTSGALAAMAVLTVASVGLSADNEKAQRSNGASSSSSDQSSNADEGDVQHHASLGVSLEEAAKGVRVIAVMPGSPAAKAGLRVGDEIRYVGDERIRTTQGLVEEIREHRPGAQVELTVRRDGQNQTLTARLTEGSTFGNRGRGQQTASTANRDNRQSNQGGDTRYYSYGPSGGQNDQRGLAQQVRSLQQQVDRLEQMVRQQSTGELRTPQAEDIQGAQPLSGQQYTTPEQTRQWSGAREWNSRQRHGEGNDDPALFQ